MTFRLTRFALRKALRALLLAGLCVGAASLAQALQLKVPGEVTDLNAMRVYSHAHPMVNETPQALKHKIDYLHHLAPADSQEPLQGILQKVGANVADFFKNFTNSTCTEVVREERLRQDGTVDEDKTQEFNYVIVAKPGDKLFRLTEYRTDKSGKEMGVAPMGGATILTSGFATMQVHLLTDFQPDSRFLFLGHEKLKHKKDELVLAFAQMPGKARQAGLFASQGMEVIILLQGVAWIDPDNYQIDRMRTDLLAPRDSIGLTRQTTDIIFGPVSFTNLPHPLWLPLQVDVEITWNNIYFRNLSVYSHYKIFNVEAGQAKRSR
jgi:hypothetical protein